MASGARVARVSTMVLPNVAITLDPRLVERMVEFILQPREHWERAGWPLEAIIFRLFPLFLMVSLLLFLLSLFFTNFLLLSSNYRWSRTPSRSMMPI